MRDPFQPDELNRALDGLLGIGNAAQPADLANAEREMLDAARRLNAVDLSGEMRPSPAQAARWKQAAKAAARPAPTARPPALRWVWAGLAVALLAVLVIFRQPVMAAVGRLFGFGYSPETGFVRLGDVRMLSRPVLQEHDGRSLTVVRGLADAEDTQIWLAYSADARPGDDAGLELPDGTRLDVLGWAWTENKPGALGVVLTFPPLPDDVSQTLLSLPEGWRLPLEWVPAEQSDLQAANVSVPYPVSPAGTVEPDSGGEPPALQPCLQTSGLEVCVRAASPSAEGLDVLVAVRSLDGALTPGTGWDMIPELLSDTLRLELVDDSGRVSPALPGSTSAAQPQGDEWLQTLRFARPAGDAQTLTLRLPGVYASAPFNPPHAIEIDLGAQPRAGQTIPLDETLRVEDMSMHYNQASVYTNPGGRLSLTLISDPIAAVNGRILAGLELGKPQGIDSGYGSGGFRLDEPRIEINADLIDPSGNIVSGTLVFPVEKAHLLLIGPFELVFSAPEAPAPAETPATAGGDFQPPAAREPLPLTGFEMGAVDAQPGDLLYSALEGANSGLYRTGTDLYARRLGTLPGQVVSFQLHADWQGMDYLTADAFNGDGTLDGVRLFSLRFGDELPREILDLPENKIVWPAWSPDGRFLAYQHVDERPGIFGRRLHVVDLTCRENGECIPQTLDVPDALDLNTPLWSPDSQHIALGGRANDSGQGGDVYVVSLNDNGTLGGYLNASASPESDDWPAQWRPDGTLVYACTAPSMPVNEYDLCQASSDGLARQSLRRLPFNMHSFILSPDGTLLLDQVMDAGQIQVRVLNITESEARLLGGGERSANFQFAPDSRRVAMLHADNKLLSVLDALSGEVTLVAEAWDGRITQVFWAR